MSRARPISTARLLVGILLHFCVPAYLLFCLAAALLRQPAVTGWGELPARMLWAAGWFAPAFGLALVAASVAGALADRRRPVAPDAVVASRIAYSDGRRLLSGLQCARLDDALLQLDRARWDHADPDHQRVAADLLAAGRSFAAAHASADPVGRERIGDLAADGVTRLADAMAASDHRRRRLDEGDARTVAGYLAARYGDDPTS